MALAAFLKAGPIPGTGTQKGREGQIPVTAFKHNVAWKVDPVGGLPGKQRVHSMFMIQKNIDFATPALHVAHAGRAELGPWTLRLFHVPKSGPEVHYFTITLKGARVAKIITVFPPLQESRNSVVHEYEQVFFDYESITFKEVAVAAYGSGPAVQAGTQSATHKIGGNTVFNAGWQEAKAKAIVLELANELKQAGMSYGGQLYDGYYAKLTGTKPPPEPVDPKPEDELELE